MATDKYQHEVSEKTKYKKKRREVFRVSFFMPMDVIFQAAISYLNKRAKLAKAGVSAGRLLSIEFFPATFGWKELDCGNENKRVKN